MPFFLEKRTQSQGYYRNFEFFRLFLDDFHNLEKYHIYQDFISDTLFWKNLQKNALFRKISHNLGAFFFWKNARKIRVIIAILNFLGYFFMTFTIWKNLIFIKILFLIHFSGKSSKKRTFSENKS